MIEITIQTAFCFYLTTLLGIVVTFWLLDNRRRSHHRPVPDAWVVRACEFCQYRYLDPREKPISLCPQCGSLNRTESPLSI